MRKTGKHPSLPGRICPNHPLAAYFFRCYSKCGGLQTNKHFQSLSQEQHMGYNLSEKHGFVFGM